MQRRTGNPQPRGARRDRHRRGHRRRGIAFARQLTAASGIPATFERADSYAWLDKAGAAGRQFAVVFCSYGFTVWLSDLDRWARGIAAVLTPRGRFVAVELHPFAMVFDYD